MLRAKGPWTDRRLESIIAGLLQGGVLLAAIFVLAGGSLLLIQHGSALPDYRVFRGEPCDLRTLAGIGADALALRTRGIIQAGLLVLIATPILRVAFCFFAFLQQRDSLYVRVTLVVLTLLLVSLFTGGLR